MNIIDDSTLVLLTGDEFKDAGPLECPVSNSNATIVPSGRFTSGISFNNNNPNLVIKLPSTSAKALTVDFWYKIRSFTSWPTPFTLKTGNYRGYYSHITATGPGLSLWETSSSGKYEGTKTACSVSAGQWNHYAYTFDNGACSVYMNGKKVCSATIPTKTITEVALGNLIQNGGDGNCYSDAIMSQFRISNKVLWAEEFEVPTEPVKIPNMKAVRKDIYLEGDEFEDITGGWNWSKGEGSSTFTKNETNLQVGCPQWSDGRLGPVNPVNAEALGFFCTTAVEIEWKANNLSGGYGKLAAGGTDLVFEGNTKIVSPSKVSYTSPIDSHFFYIANTSSGSAGNFQISRVTVIGKVLLDERLPSGFTPKYLDSLKRVLITWEALENPVHKVVLVKSDKVISAPEEGTVLGTFTSADTAQYVDKTVQQYETVYYSLFVYDGEELVADYLSEEVICGQRPTKAVRDYNTYPKMYGMLTSGELTEFIPNRTPNPNGTSKWIGNCTNLRSNEVWNTFFGKTKLVFYKGSSYTGQDVTYNTANDINSPGSYIIVDFHFGAMGSGNGAQINLSFDGGSSYISIDKAIELQLIDPVVLSNHSFHTSYPVRDSEFLFTGAMTNPKSDYPTHGIAFRPLEKLPIIKFRMEGYFSSSYDDGTSIYTTQVAQISPDEFLLAKVTLKEAEYNAEEECMNFSWKMPDANLVSKIAIYRSLDSLEENPTSGELLEEITELAITSFTDTNIEYGFTYNYAFVCYDSDGEVLPEVTTISLLAASPMKVRYIRDWLNGSTSNGGNHWVEIQAFSAGTNVARGKSVINGPNRTAGNTQDYPTRVTDGSTDTSSYHEFARPAGEPGWVQVDLAEAFLLDSIKIHHYYSDSRTYYGSRTEVSPDGNAWYTVFDSAVSGTYAESSAGKTHTVNLMDNAIPDYYDQFPAYMIQNGDIVYDGGVTLTWDPPTSEDVTGIVIRRCEGRTPVNPQDGDLVFEDNTLEITSFTDLRVLRNKTYTYMVYTHNAQGEYYPGYRLSVLAVLPETLFPKKFTSCGASGRVGPTQTQVDSTYSKSGNLKGQVSCIAGYQFWTVPTDGYYTITAHGAAGGCGSDYGATGGGRGAQISGEIYLEEGTQLIIVVGQKGQDAPGDSDGGGGGGTFVVKLDEESEHILTLGDNSYPVTPLVVAGGGGAVSADSTGHDASLTADSTRSNSATPIGHGAKHGDGGGGGGFLSTGKNGGNGSTGGQGFLLGALGGNSARQGGFGCGAGGYDEYGAGGGGYTGAPGYDGPSGGGGSYIHEDFAEVVKSIPNVRTDGSVTITIRDAANVGFFLKDVDDVFWTYEAAEDAWVPLEEGITQDIIRNQALTKLPYELMCRLPDSVPVKGVDKVVDSIPYKVVALPLSNVIYPTVGHDVQDRWIVNVTADATDEVSFIVSVDQGNTWKYFDGEDWVDYADDLVGMPPTVMNVISRNLWKRLGYDEELRIAFIVQANDYVRTTKVKEVKIKTIERL